MIGADSRNLKFKVSLWLRIKIYLSKKYKVMSLSLQFKNMSHNHQFKGMNLFLNNFYQVTTSLKLNSYKIKDKTINMKHWIEFTKQKISVKIPISMNGMIGKTRKFPQ